MTSNQFISNQRLENRNPQVVALVEQANERLANNNTAEAYPLLSEIATELSDDLSSQIIAGCAAAALGDYSEARGWFNRALQIDPANLEATHNLALTHLREGDFTSAIGRLRESVDSGVADAALLNDLGVAYLKANEPTGARGAFRRALYIDPSNGATKDALFEIFRMTGDRRRARRYLRVWLRSGLNPESHERWREIVRQISNNTRENEGGRDRAADITDPLTVKVAMFATQPGFLSDIERHLGLANEVRSFQSGALAEMRELLQWCDIAWFDWCDSLLIQATNHLPKTCPIVCRLHSYEAFTEMPEQVNWSMVDLVIFVNRSVEALVKPRLPEELETTVIPNAVDTNRFSITRKTLGKKIASVGYINYKKNPQLLLYVMAELKKWDPEFELHIAGQHQDSRIELYFKDMAAKLGLEIQYHGWVRDMPEFYQEMDFVISTSLFESFHYSIAEGMACGLIPLVHDWFGASEIYPEEYRFRTPSECLSIIKRVMEQDRMEVGRQARRHIVELFDLPGQLAAVDAALNAVLAKSKPEDKTVDLGLVSIVIPTYNRADMLAEAISSALNQTYTNCEIVVVNDGSTDNTLDVLDECEKQFPGRVRVIHQENRGVSGALNTAIRNSRGQYISWLSSDDAYHPDKVWEQVKVLDARPDLGWVYSDFYYIDANSTLTGRANVAPLDNESFVEKMFEGNPVHGCSVMFRRSNLEKTGLFDETLGGKIGYGADGALWHKMGYHFKFEFINKPLVYYRLHPGQVTHQADIPKHKEEYRVYMNRYFDSVRAENESVDSAPAVIATRFESVDPGERLGFNADPDFPEQKPTGQRILWIGTADPCGNAAMYARAVNRHTEHLCRVVTFKETRGFDQDIVLRRQRWAGDDGFSNELTPAEESRLRDLAERADILVFSACSYSKMGLPATRMDDTDQLKWGKIDWADYSSHKPCVAFFFGSTATRANANWYWDLFSQQKKWRVATGQLDLKRRWKDALYVPTWLDVDAPRYRREIVAARNTLVVQTPTDPPIKNSRELESAVRDLLPDYPNLSLAIKTGLSYQEALELKRQGQIALDQMQVNDGYYCMSSLENSALGLVNFVYVDQFGLDKIAETLKTDKMPWHIVKNESELRAGIKSLLDDPDRIFETQRETYAWMRQHWHPSRLVHYLTDAILN